MPRLTLVHSFLDRFEQRLQVDCEQLKRQLVAQVDQQFGVLRSNVAELRSRFVVTRPGTVNIDPWIDDPPVETVQLDQCKQEQLEMMESSNNARHVPSTSTGHKRKSSSTSQTVNNKRHKTVTTHGSNKNLCKSPGCGKSFRDKYDLSRHGRIHLSVKAFSCTWPDCRYSAVQKGHVVQHVRGKHFKLPLLQKDQSRLNIVDNRNPEDYIRVDNQLLERRLELNPVT